MSEIKNLSAQINLTKLSRACVTEVPGKNDNNVVCVLIPVYENDIYLGKDGAAYLNLSIRESKEIMFDQTHYIKQAFSKDFREANPDMFTEENRNQFPILGNAKPLIFKNQPVEVKTITAVTEEAKDDLPF